MYDEQLYCCQVCSITTSFCENIHNLAETDHRATKILHLETDFDEKIEVMEHLW